jgi:putative membrane protein
MMLPPAWAVAGVITRRWQGKPFYRLRFVLISALTFTAWDLFLDPQMVSWRLWLWENPGDFSYFGIPWVNFAGWLLVSMIMTAAASAVFGAALPGKLPPRPLLAVYAITWALQTIGQLCFWGLPGAGAGRRRGDGRVPAGGAAHAARLSCGGRGRFHTQDFQRCVRVNAARG